VQLVFLDTPGVLKPQTRLGDFMKQSIEEAMSGVDAALMVVEPTAECRPEEAALIEQIKNEKLPTVLAINKIDTVEKETLLEVIATYTQAHEFDAVVPLSAKTGDGVNVLLEELQKMCFESPQLFPEDMISDQPERQLIAEIIREKLLQNLDKEVPHGVAVEIEMMKEENGVEHISAVIYCERKTHKGIIIGKNGAMLKKVGATARPEIEELLDCKVFLQLWVKIKEDWRNNPAQIRNFGYSEEG
jgi:GTP-binding protein Era